MTTEMEIGMPKRDPAHMNAQRERILRATIMCISHVGIERTSIASICRQAKLSAGALYVHFKNKDEIIAETLRFGTMNDFTPPSTWAAFKAEMISLDDQMGFDIGTVTRARLQLAAECVHPGPLHDLLKPGITVSLASLSAHLQAMNDSGELALRMTARQTATSMISMIDGMIWIALASDRPLADLHPDLAAGLDCLVTVPDGRAGQGQGEAHIKGPARA